MNVFDCGARGGPHRSWQDFGLPVTYVCFEPDSEEAESITRMTEKSLADGVKLIVANTAVDETEGVVNLNLYHRGGLSSLFQLNTAETYRYGKVRLDRQVEVRATTLDKFSTDHDLLPHFLSIDAQGATLRVLKGGEKVLRHILGIRCETEFFYLYKNADLFDAVFASFRERSYRLLRTEMCGPGLYGISTEMNEFSISPWDARPSSCDMIYANTPRINELIERGHDPAAAEAIAYFVAFCIHNGSGYYGMEVLQRLADANKIEDFHHLLPPEIANPLVGQVALYLSMPRQNVNEGFDGREVFHAFFGGDLIEAMSTVGTAVRKKIMKIYSQKYDVLNGEV